MKKLLLTGALFAMSFGATLQAQAPLKTTATNTAVIVDTLHYYLNKYYFKMNGNTDSLKHYPKFRTDATALASFTGVTFCGSIFEVPPGETVLVTGLEAFAEKVRTTANLNIPIRLYIFNVGANGLPLMPPIDSVNTTVGANSVENPVNVGGNFTSTLTLAARTRTASFAVAMRNMSGASGDFAYLLRTNGVTQASPLGLLRYSDSKGFVRYLGQFVSTKDFQHPDFGTNTDYEFMVAPRVVYTVQASQIMPSYAVSNDDTVSVATEECTKNPMTFTNTSSKFFEHRMYNLNQFYRKWNLYGQLNYQNSFAADSSITWNFEFFDNFYFNYNARVFLPYVNNGKITVTNSLAYPPNTTDCFKANQFRARLKPMGAKGRVPQHVFNQDFTLCFKYCDGDTVGLTSLSTYDDLKLFPNPAANGKTEISGLKGKNNVVVYNMIGETVLTEVTEAKRYEIDLSKQPKGTYLVRINNSLNQYKVIKVLKE